VRLGFTWRYRILDNNTILKINHHSSARHPFVYPDMFAVSLPSEANAKKENPSIIDIANAAYSMTPSAGVSIASTNIQKLKSSDVTWNTSSRNKSTSSTSFDERLEAARAMLGISPCSVTDGSVGYMMGDRTSAKFKQRHSSTPGSSQSSGDRQVEGSVSGTNQSSNLPNARRSRSDSVGLEALAFLATQEQEAQEAAVAPYSSVSLVPTATVTSSDDDSEIMPPPPPRTTVTRRRRSVSNPEGMDKWGLPTTSSTMDCDKESTPQTMRRLRLVLPASILEEEIAEANAAVVAKERSTASASALAASLLSEKNNTNGINMVYGGSHLPLVEEEEDDDDENLDHDELLRRARSRLLEDLSQSNLSGEKGVLTLPHSLRKYKEVYNKNGRIGIYTPAERAAIIARFQSKRTRRVWNKKIRYNCRKNLADRRLRVKGRFVKRTATPTVVTNETPKTTRIAPAEKISSTKEKTSITSSVVSSNPEDIKVDQADRDTEMPDVTDPNAGFCPTDDQPYRRLRRHTIT